MAAVKYSHHKYGTFVAIWDESNQAQEGEAFMSVTNAVEQVLREIIEDVRDAKVVYRDTEGKWDEIVHDRGKFKDFAPLQQDSMEAAFEALRQKYPVARK